MTYKQETIKPYAREGSKGEQVEQMFDTIAPTYDLLNHALSLGIDRSWRKAAIAQLKPHAPRRILDVATGTGDFAILAAQRGGGCGLRSSVCAGQRHRRLHTPTRRILRSGGHEAHLRPRFPQRACGLCLVS